MEYNKRSIEGAEIWVDEYDIVNIAIEPEFYIELEHITEQLKVAQELAPKKTGNLVLIHSAHLNGMSLAARRFNNSPPMVNFHAAKAVVVQNRISKLVANFVKGFSTPVYPLRVFVDAPTAAKWLLNNSA